MAVFNARFEEVANFHACFKSETTAFLASFSNVVGPVYVPTYDGPTDIIPSTEDDQILNTSGKQVMSDIRVREIPTSEVSNLFGGTTFIIGG